MNAIPWILVALAHTCLGNREQGHATLDFVGDINFDGPVRVYNDLGICSYQDTMRDVAGLLRQSDVAIANLESPLVPQRFRKNYYKQIPRLQADPSCVGALKFAGFNVLSLANNHMSDYGEEATNYTMAGLERNGFKSFGINYGSALDSQEPLIIDVNGIKIGLLAYCAVHHNAVHENGVRHNIEMCTLRRGSHQIGAAVYSKETTARDVQTLKGKVDVMVVFMHWGIEGAQHPTKNETIMATHLQSLGVHLIIGAHPHVLQGHTRHGNSITAFSLGNFLFGPTGFKLQHFYYGRMPSLEVQRALIKYTLTKHDPSLLSRILRITINKKGVESAKYLPVQIKYNIKSKCLQPSPNYKTGWIEVCGKKDPHCLN